MTHSVLLLTNVCGCRSCLCRRHIDNDSSNRPTIKMSHPYSRKSNRPPIYTHTHTRAHTHTHTQIYMYSVHTRVRVLQYKRNAPYPTNTLGLGPGFAAWTNTFWTPTRTCWTSLCSNAARKVVHTMVAIIIRSHQLPEEQGEGSAGLRALPVMPTEMWLYILRLVRPWELGSA